MCQALEPTQSQEELEFDLLAENREAYVCPSKVACTPGTLHSWAAC